MNLALKTSKSLILLKWGVILFNLSYCHRQLLAEYRGTFTTKHIITLQCTITIHNS